VSPGARATGSLACDAQGSGARTGFKCCGGLATAALGRAEAARPPEELCGGAPEERREGWRAVGEATAGATAGGRAAGGSSQAVGRGANRQEGAQAASRIFYTVN